MGPKKIVMGIIGTSVMCFTLASCNSTSKKATTTDQTTTDQTIVATEDQAKVTTKITYPLVDTNQGLCYDNDAQIEGPAEGEPFYGQDAQYTGNIPSYTDNGDGTITDNVTGLIWTQELSSYSMVWDDASAYCENLEVGGITNWRLPTIKELWSIRDFSQGWPWVDTDYFHLVGDGSQGAQEHSWSSNYYLVDTDEAVKHVAFAVNDWTGHIKVFDGKRFVRAVCGSIYGDNDFVNNNNGTITDNATGLMWAQDDSGKAMNWEDALSYAENSTLDGYDDWRLPNAKELQSIVDYSGCFPAIDTSVFHISPITNEAGNTDYPYFWTSTTNPYIDVHEAEGTGYCYAWYVAFGYAVGPDGQDMHGAGAVRFDTKSDEGQEGIDGERVNNYVRLVRGGNVTKTPQGDPSTVKADRVVVFADGETGMPTGAMGPAKPSDVPMGKSNKQGGQPQARPDFTAAAKTLGVTEDALVAALGDPQKGQPDFTAVAKILGVSEEALKNALSVPDGMNTKQSGQPQKGQMQGGQPQGRPNFSAAAKTLGVTEEAIMAALGDPQKGQPDFATAAATLGVTKDALMAALGITSPAQ